MHDCVARAQYPLRLAGRGTGSWSAGLARWRCREPSRQLYIGARVLRVLSLEPLHPLQLLIGVPPGCGEVFSQFLRGAPRTVPGRVTLDTPPFLQGAGVHRVEAELVEQLRDRGLRSRIVASYGKRTAVVRARPLSVGRELRRVNVVECLDDLRGRQVRLQELRGGRRLVVELLDVAVSLWVVVVRVDHDLARQGLDRNLPVVLERDGDHNDVPSLCGVDSRRRARIRSELGNERRQGFRPTRVADHNPVAVCRRKSRDLASDLTGADESYGLHASCHPNIDLDRGGVEQYRCQCRSGRELYRVLEEYVVRQMRRAGFQEVRTPQLLSFVALGAKRPPGKIWRRHVHDLRDAHPAVLRLPVEVGRTADPMLAGQLAECDSGFAFLQDRNDL